MSKAERQAYWDARNRQRITEQCDATIRSHDMQITALNVALGLADPFDVEFIEAIKTQIEAHETDKRNARRKLVLDLTGARLNDHDF